MKTTMRGFRIGGVFAALALFGGDSRAQGFVPLFNGRDLSGWIEMVKPGGFVVEDGVLALKSPGQRQEGRRIARAQAA